MTKNKNIDHVLNIYEHLGLPVPSHDSGNLYIGSVHAMLRKKCFQERNITSILSLLIPQRYESQKVKKKVCDMLFDVDIEDG